MFSRKHTKAFPVAQNPWNGGERNKIGQRERLSCNAVQTASIATVLGIRTGNHGGEVGILGFCLPYRPYGVSITILNLHAVV